MRGILLPGERLLVAGGRDILTIVQPAVVVDIQQVALHPTVVRNHIQETAYLVQTGVS